MRTLAMLAAAAMLAGCSSTGTSSGDPEPMPEPEPFPDNVNEALADGLEGAMVHGAPMTVETGTAAFAMDEPGNHMSVEVDGATYSMAAVGPPTPYSAAPWQNPVSYQSYVFSNSDDDGAVLLGQYMALASVFPLAGGSYYMRGGLETPQSGLPAQLVEYEGGWSVNTVDVAPGSASGLFEADADFDAGTIQFHLTQSDGTTALGTGAGTITGNIFVSAFDVTSGAHQSTNTVEGNFYGPGAEEMAGLIAGTAGAVGTVGYVFGHRQ